MFGSLKLPAIGALLFFGLAPDLTARDQTRYEIKFSTQRIFSVEIRQETVYRIGPGGPRTVQVRIYNNRTNELQGAAFPERNGRWASFDKSNLSDTLRKQIELVDRLNPPLIRIKNSTQPKLNIDGSLKPGETGDLVLIEDPDSRIEPQYPLDLNATPSKMSGTDSPTGNPRMSPAQRTKNARLNALLVRKAQNGGYMTVSDGAELKILQAGGSTEYAKLEAKAENGEEMSDAEKAELAAYQRGGSDTYAQLEAKKVAKEAEGRRLSPPDNAMLKVYESGGNDNIARIAARIASGGNLGPQDAQLLNSFWARRALGQESGDAGPAAQGGGQILGAGSTSSD